MSGEKVINLFVCCDKVSSSLVDVENWQLSQAKSSHVSRNTGFTWYDYNARLLPVCERVFFLLLLLFFTGHWQLIPFSMEKQWNVDLVTSKAAKKEEAKTVFITGWHPSPNIRSFSLDLFLSTLNTFSTEKNKNEQR